MLLIYETWCVGWGQQEGTAFKSYIYVYFKLRID